MSAKSIRFHDLARYKMFAGVNMLADAVNATRGPEGGDVVCGDLVERDVVRGRRRRPRLHRISLEAH